MRSIVGLLFLLLTPLAWASSAHASGDWGCSLSWKLVHPAYDECSNMAILSPGNDTRTNLVLLLIDRHGAEGLPRGGRSRSDSAKPLDALFDWQTLRNELYAKPQSDDDSYASGEGSRCRSNASGASAFNDAILANHRVPDAERSILVEARGALQPGCTGDTPSGADKIAEAAARVKSSQGKAFARYLQGALAFYDGDFDVASKYFLALRSAPDPWVRETARYMLGRVEVNRAQYGAFTDYGSLDMAKVDQKAIDDAEAGFLAYIHDYPRGLYTASARGLLRRVYWLGGRTAKLAAQYAALFSADPATRGIDDGDLAEEIDNKLLGSLKPADTNDPVLLAMIDLYLMRSCAAEQAADTACGQIQRPQLETQRALFSRDPTLFDYLIAAYALYIENKPNEALQLLGGAQPRGALTYLALSRQTLHGMALERLGQIDAANAWLPLLAGATLPYQRPLLELAVARTWERSRMPARILDSASPVRAPVLRETVITYVADARLLRAHYHDAKAPAHERELALYILLYKELTRGAYRDFLADLPLAPPGAGTEGNTWSPMTGEQIPLGTFGQDKGTDGFACPPIKSVATKLAANPVDTHARLCVAEFARANGFDYSAIDTPPPAEELGGTSLFPGAPFSRLEIYKAIMADARAPAPDKAYALYRAVRCYAPSGHNSCGGTDVPVAQRKAWFQRLKAEFAASPWAKDLEYYW
jgi:hypothetical protein